MSKEKLGDRPIGRTPGFDPGNLCSTRSPPAKKGIMAKCECRVIGGPHDEWCDAHPSNVRIEELEQEVESLEEQLRDAKALGLEKAAKICEYHASLPMRNEAFKAACRDIKISCEATACRIRRFEPEDPSTEIDEFSGIQPTWQV